MTDNDHDVLEAGDLDADSGLEDFDTGGRAAGDSWKSNPMVKIGMVVGGLAILVGGFTLFGGGNKTPIAPSAVSSAGNALKDTPGGKVPDLYAKALTETNEAAVEQAIKTGTSSLPVPIGPSKGKVEVETNKESSEDPLERWRRIQEERTKKEQQAKVEPTTAAAVSTVDPYKEQKESLSRSMQQQMQSVLESQKINDVHAERVTDSDWLQKKRKEAAAEAEKVATDKSEKAAASAAAASVEVLLEPGRIEYAQLIIEADSDVPGPVLAELASGPLVGDRLIGSFKKQDDYLTLAFDTVVVNGVGLSAEAIALDPETSKPGIVTDVDHKYFTRVILPAASAFITGIGGAIADSGSTTVAAGEGTATTAQNPLNAKQEFFKGVEKASSKLGEVLDQEAQQAQVRVRVAAGTHIGVLFTKEVVNTPRSATQPALGPAQQATPAQQILLQLQPAMAQGQTAVQQAVQGQTSQTSKQ